MTKQPLEFKSERVREPISGMTRAANAPIPNDLRQAALRHA